MLDAQDRLAILVKIQDFYRVSKDFKGTFVIQTFIAYANSQAEEDTLLASVLKQDFTSLATNSNGIHVLVKLAKTFPKGSVSRLYQVAL